MKVCQRKEVNVDKETSIKSVTERGGAGGKIARWRRQGEGEGRGVQPKLTPRPATSSQVMSEMMRESDGRGLCVGWRGTGRRGKN